MWKPSRRDIGNTYPTSRNFVKVDEDTGLSLSLSPFDAGCLDIVEAWPCLTGMMDLIVFSCFDNHVFHGSDDDEGQFRVTSLWDA